MRLKDADALKEVLKEYYNAPHVHVVGSGVSAGLEMGIKGCLILLDNAPTIEAEPVRHGRWVYAKTYQGMKYVCSICGEIPECFEPNYCPNCGAKVDLRD